MINGKDFPTDNPTCLNYHMFCIWKHKHLMEKICWNLKFALSFNSEEFLTTGKYLFNVFRQCSCHDTVQWFYNVSFAKRQNLYFHNAESILEHKLFHKYFHLLIPPKISLPSKLQDNFDFFFMYSKYEIFRGHWA